MAPGKFLFKSDDPELRHITISLEVGISSYQTYEAKVFKIIDGDTLQVLLTALDCYRRSKMDPPMDKQWTHCESL